MDMLIHIYYGSKIRANTSVVSTQTQIQIKMLTSFLLIAEKMVWLFKDEILFACFFVLFMWEGKGYRKKWQLGFLLLWFCICCLGLALEAHRYWQQMTKLISIDVGALWGLPWMYKTVQNWTPVGHWFIVFWRTIDWVWTDALSHLVQIAPHFPSSSIFLLFFLFPSLHLWELSDILKSTRLEVGCCGSCFRWNLFWCNFTNRGLPWTQLYGCFTRSSESPCQNTRAICLVNNCPIITWTVSERDL